MLLPPIFMPGRARACSSPREDGDPLGSTGTGLINSRPLSPATQAAKATKTKARARGPARPDWIPWYIPLRTGRCSGRDPPLHWLIFLPQVYQITPVLTLYIRY